MKAVWGHLRTMWKPLLGAALTGVSTGFLGALFFNVIDWATDIFRDAPALVWLLPAAGLLTVWLYKKAGNVGDTNRVLEGARGEATVSPLMAPLICVSTIATRLLGGSVGTEGAAIQAGGGLAKLCGNCLSLNEEQQRVVLMSGISAGFASIVGVPVTAIVLALEIAGVGVMYYGAILPCAVSSVVSYAIASSFGSRFPEFVIDRAPSLSAEPIFQVILLSALCGLVAIAECKAIYWTGKLQKTWSPYVRVLAGGAAVALLTTLAGTTAYNSGGLNLMKDAWDQGSQWYDFILKLLFTAVTLGSGFKGGAIEPTLSIGAAFGGFMGPALGLPAPLGMGIGLSAVFCGAINCPISSFVLGLEIFGVNGSLYILLGCAVSYVCSGYCSLYPAQKFLEGKFGSLQRRQAEE